MHRSAPFAAVFLVAGLALIAGVESTDFARNASYALIGIGGLGALEILFSRLRRQARRMVGMAGGAGAGVGLSIDVSEGGGEGDGGCGGGCGD